jgi:hypothetical protein
VERILTKELVIVHVLGIEEQRFYWVT